MHTRVLGIGLVVASIVLLVSDPVGALVGRWAPDSLTSIMSRNSLTCAAADGKAYCWGRNDYGQLGIGSTDADAHSLPVKVDDTGVLAGKTVTKVSAGSQFYACAIASGKAYCWGRNAFWQLGIGTTVDSPVPIAVVDTGVLSGKTLVDIATGDGHVCVIDSAGKAYCWGAGGNGRLGNGGTAVAGFPVAVTDSGALSGVALTSIIAGSGYTCASGTTSGGAKRAYCWGSNADGQIGDGSVLGGNVLTPSAVSTTSGALLTKDVRSIAIGAANSSACAVTEAPDSKVYCWGRNNAGQIGDGTTTNVSVPAAVLTSGVLSGKTITQVSTGNLKTCALDSNGAAYCWGDGPTGGSPYSSSSPTAVNVAGVLSGVQLGFIANGDSTCAISVESRAYCWGINGYGNLGDNTITSRNTPIEVLASGDIRSSEYRFYAGASSTSPGVPLAADNTPAQLSYLGQAFRLRMGISPLAASTTPIDIRQNDASLKLQFAERTTASCSIQTTGFQDVTTSTEVAYRAVSGVSNGAAIATHGNDPTVSGTVVPQTLRSANGSFSNVVAIKQGQTGLWDFSLYDNGMTRGERYCLKLVYSSGAELEELPVGFAEIELALFEDISVSIIDINGEPISDPTFTMIASPWATSCTQSLGAFFDPNKRLRVYNGGATNGWTVSVAATNGPTAKWETSDGTRRYDFNDASGSPAGCGSGSDGDSLAGGLGFWMDLGTITPASDCNTTGVTKGVNTEFVQGSQDAITLMSGAPGSQLGCYWDLSYIFFRQQIPAYQPPGEYSLDLTISAVAS